MPLRCAGSRNWQSPHQCRWEYEDFFYKNIEWLTVTLTAAGFSDTKAKANALHILASLEGAMIVSKSLDENAVFESVAKTLVKFADH